MDKVAGDLEPIDQIVDTLSELCARNQTGRLVVQSDNKKLFWISIGDGEISSAKYDDAEGMAAIEAIAANVRSGRATFAPASKAVTSATPMPTTTEVLTRLVSGGRGPSPGAASPSTRAGQGLSDSEKKAITDVLVGLIGPMGALLSEGVLASATDPNSAIDALAAEIPDPSAAAAFAEQARARTNS